MHNIHSLLFLRMQGRQNLQGEERKTKRGRKEKAFEFPLLTEEILLYYVSHKILCCFHLFKNNGELFGLDIHCWLLLQTLNICSSNIWLWWWTWGCAGSLSSICYSCVGTDGFIFTRLRYTVLKTCRDVSFALTEVTCFVFLFHFLSCHFCGLFELFSGLLSLVVLTAQLLFLPLCNLPETEVWNCCFNIFLKIELIPFLEEREEGTEEYLREF